MDKKINTQKERKYKEYFDLYKNNNLIDKINYNDICKIVKMIKNDYKDKMKSENFDIVAQKIRLKNDIGKYNTPYINSLSGFFTAISSALFALFLQSLGIFNINIFFLSKTLSDSINMALKVAIFLALLWYIGKNLNDTTSKKII